jgi:hypothetical protein
MNERNHGGVLDPADAAGLEVVHRHAHQFRKVQDRFHGNAPWAFGQTRSAGPAHPMRFDEYDALYTAVP